MLFLILVFLIKNSLCLKIFAYSRKYVIHTYIILVVLTKWNLNWPLNKKIKIFLLKKVEI